MKRIIVLTILLATLAVSAHADRRYYVWTYQFMTMPPDAAELELYQTTRLNTTDSWEYRAELEHGITDRFDIAIYQIFTQKEGESFTWDAFQLRTRYKLAQKGQFFLDPLLYLEYRRKIDLKAQNKLEAKLILARDIDRYNVAINPVYEFFWAPGDPVHEFGLDIGLSYSPTFKFTFGVEATGRYEILKDEENESSLYIGPTVSFASGPIWYNIGWAGGVTDDSDDARVRFLMGVDL